jgi:AraC family transcriptional regulator
MCTVGAPIGGVAAKSVLRTETGVHQWGDFPRGHISFIPAGLPIDWEWNYASRSVHLAIRPEFLDALAREMEIPNGAELELRPTFRVLEESLSRPLVELGAEAAANGKGSRLATSSLITVIGVRLLRFAAAGRGTDRKGSASSAGLAAAIRHRCVEMMQDRLDENVSLAELAGELRLSPFHFARLFKEATGFPPHEYQLQLRVRRAQKLLLQTPRRTVAEIACELGFADESHLRRHFKRIVGMTPGQFRR